MATNKRIKRKSEKSSKQDPLARLADDLPKMKKVPKTTHPGELVKAIETDTYRKAGAASKRRARDG